MKTDCDRSMDPLVQLVLSQPWENEAFYREYLAQTYHYVVYSTRMLATAAGMTAPEQQTYYRRSLRHISEEAAHENLALNDLKAFDDAAEAHPELGVTRALWEPQFYKIQRQPTALLGYVLALEYMTARSYGQVCERLEKQHGAKRVSFVRLHADEDPDHVEKAREQIDALSDVEQVEIWKNYDQTCGMYGLFLQETAVKAARPAQDGRRTGRAA